jgi:hypothetical protein
MTSLPLRFSAGVQALVVLLSMLGLATAAADAEDPPAAPWHLDRSEDGIEVYTRPVEGSGVKAFKGVATVHASVDVILRVLRDSDRFKTWFPNTSESRLLDREGPVSHQYSVMDAPWPVEDRDNVLRSVTSRDAGTGVVEIVVDAEPDYYPVQVDRIRVQKAHGSWRLEPIGKDETRVTFMMHLEPGGGVPEWLINLRVVASPYEALTNLRKVVRR